MEYLRDDANTSSGYCLFYSLFLCFVGSPTQCTKSVTFNALAGLKWQRSCADFTRSVTSCSCHIVHGSEPDLSLILSPRNWENCQHDSFTASHLEHNPWSYKCEELPDNPPCMVLPFCERSYSLLQHTRNSGRVPLFPCMICPLMGYSQYYYQKRTSLPANIPKKGWIVWIDVRNYSPPSC